MENEMIVTAEELHILRHSLGLTLPGDEPYRNYYCTGPTADNYADCENLVGKGLMVRGKSQVKEGSLIYFHVTDKGKDLASTEEAISECVPTSLSLEPYTPGCEIVFDSGPGDIPDSCEVCEERLEKMYELGWPVTKKVTMNSLFRSFPIKEYKDGVTLFYDVFGGRIIYTASYLGEHFARDEDEGSKDAIPEEALSRLWCYVVKEDIL